MFKTGIHDVVYNYTKIKEEEERRLCFVAMTRARHKLYLTESEGFGVKGFSKVPSRFIFDIDRKLLDLTGKVPEEVRSEQQHQIRQFNKEERVVYMVGDQMRHKVFGEGVIEEVDEKNKTYYIRFVGGVKPISFSYNGLSHIF